MRWLTAIIVLFTIQLQAEAQESADFSSHVNETWGQSPDAFVRDKYQNEARVKAFIRELLGEERVPSPAETEESSGAVETSR